MNKVEVVVSHFRRPSNIPKILAALRAQTVPVTCTLTDASDSISAIDTTCWDRVFRMEPMGAWERLAIAGAYAHEFTLFLDDDVLPSPNFAESFLMASEALQGRFSVLGCHGRRYEFDRIWFIDLPETSEFVHWLARVYFFRTEHLIWALDERRRCGFEITAKASNFDAIMCYGISRRIGQPCYATPSPAGTDWDSLDQNDALSKAEGYEELLTNCIKRILT